MRLTLLAALLAPLALAACAQGPRVWYAQGVSAEHTTMDLHECSQIAVQRIYREEGVLLPAVDAYPQSGLDEHFEEERRLRQRYIQDCMSQRGYRLVPRDEVRRGTEAAPLR